MQISRTSLTSLTSLLSYSALTFSAIIPQVPLDYDPAPEGSYGYKGPGTYRITSYLNNYAVSLNTSDSTTGIVAL